MVLDIQSKEVIDKISDELKVQPSLEIPRQLAEKIQLVYKINPEYNIQAKSANAVDTTTATIHTTSSTKDTYLIGASLTISKDAIATSTQSGIECTPEASDVQVSILRIRYEPTTAGNFTESISFSKPIKLKRNTTINTTNVTAVASIDNSGVVYFYETDPQ